MNNWKFTLPSFPLDAEPPSMNIWNPQPADDESNVLPIINCRSELPDWSSFIFIHVFKVKSVTSLAFVRKLHLQCSVYPYAQLSPSKSIAYPVSLDGPATDSAEPSILLFS